MIYLFNLFNNLIKFKFKVNGYLLLKQKKLDYNIQNY